MAPMVDLKLFTSTNLNGKNGRLLFSVYVYPEVEHFYYEKLQIYKLYRKENNHAV